MPQTLEQNLEEYGIMIHMDCIWVAGGKTQQVHFLLRNLHTTGRPVAMEIQDPIYIVMEIVGRYIHLLHNRLIITLKYKSGTISSILNRCDGSCCAARITIVLSQSNKIAL